MRIWQCEWSYRRSVTRDCKRLRSPPISWQEVQCFPKVFQERPEARASHPRPQQKLYCAPWRLLDAGSCLLVREEWPASVSAWRAMGGGSSCASYKYPLIDGEKKPACAAKLHNKAASVPKHENILQASRFSFPRGDVLTPRPILEQGSRSLACPLVRCLR